MSTELNESNFYQTLKSTANLVLVDFHAPWCGPCRMLSPILEQLQNVDVVKVNGDDNQNLVTQESVSAYPTMVFYRNGEEIRREVGLRSLEQLQDIVDEHTTGG